MKKNKDMDDKRKMAKDRRALKNEEGIRKIWDRRVPDWDRRAVKPEATKKNKK